MILSLKKFISNPFIELLIRFLYFNFHLEKPLFLLKRKDVRKVTISEILDSFDGYDFIGKDIMIHSSFKRIDCSPEELIKFFIDQIGPEGNLLMPTHPIEKYNTDGDIVYDVEKSESKVGYLTEVFRKYPGVKRSFHPFSSIAVWGKDQDWYLENNLNKDRPLPHGIYSPYYKFAKKGGIVICIGVSAIKRATVRHVAEEVLDQHFPVKGMFKEYNAIIYNKSTLVGKYKVRKADLKKTQIFISKAKLEINLMRNGIIKKKVVSGTPIEFIDSKEYLNFLLNEIERGETYYTFAPKKRIDCKEK